MSWASIAKKGHIIEQQRNKQEQYEQKIIDSILPKLPFNLGKLLIDYCKKINVNLTIDCLIEISRHVNNIQIIPRYGRDIYNQWGLDKTTFTRFSPYKNLPYHDFSCYKYEIYGSFNKNFIEFKFFMVDQSKSFHIKISLYGDYVHKDYLQLYNTIGKLISDCNTFEQFQNKLSIILINNGRLERNHWDGPEILDPRNNFWKMRQLWSLLNMMKYSIYM